MARGNQGREPRDGDDDNRWQRGNRVFEWTCHYQTVPASLAPNLHGCMYTCNGRFPCEICETRIRAARRKRPSPDGYTFGYDGQALLCLRHEDPPPVSSDTSLAIVEERSDLLVDSDWFDGWIRSDGAGDGGC